MKAHTRPQANRNNTLHALLACENLIDDLSLPLDKLGLNDALLKEYKKQAQIYYNLSLPSMPSNLDELPIRKKEGMSARETCQDFLKNNLLSITSDFFESSEISHELNIDTKKMVSLFDNLIDIANINSNNLDKTITVCAVLFNLRFLAELLKKPEFPFPSQIPSLQQAKDDFKDLLEFSGPNCPHPNQLELKEVMKKKTPTGIMGFFRTVKLETNGESRQFYSLGTKASDHFSLRQRLACPCNNKLSAIERWKSVAERLRSAKIEVTRELKNHFTRHNPHRTNQTEKTLSQAHTSHQTPSDFRPDTLAKLIHYLKKKFPQSISNLFIFLPCIGWGGRLLGAVTSRPQEIVGVDTNTRLLSCYKQMIVGLSSRTTEYSNSDTEWTGATTLVIPEKTGTKMHEIQRIQLLSNPAEEVKFDNRFTLTVTSPPYFDTEKYPGDNSSHNKYKQYSEWLNSFLYPLIMNIIRSTKPGGFFAINIANSNKHPIADDTFKYLESWNNKQEARNIYKMIFTVGTFQYFYSTKGEPFFIFRVAQLLSPQSGHLISTTAYMLQQLDALSQLQPQHLNEESHRTKRPLDTSQDTQESKEPKSSSDETELMPASQSRHFLL